MAIYSTKLAPVQFASSVPDSDPEGMNFNRATWAQTAVQAFVDLTGADSEDAVADLLCDLRHLCDRTGRDFPAELARAMSYYDEDTRK